MVGIQIWTPARLNDGRPASDGRGAYGFGWFLSEQHGHRVISHGGITGVEMTRYPDDRLTVIVLTNLGFSFIPGAEMPNSWGLTQAIAGFYIPDLVDRPAGAKTAGE